MEESIFSPRKLIEVAMPLDNINAAAAKEKNNPFLKGHPRNLHQWWARRPTAVARAILFAQMVNDPGYEAGRGFKYGRNKQEAQLKRKELFELMSELAKWENVNNQDVLGRARAEILKSWAEICTLNQRHPMASSLFNPSELPIVWDPFAGGGAIPLEGKRLGLSVEATDLNPVAVVINKALVDIPSRFNGQASITSGQHLDELPLKPRRSERQVQGLEGLCADLVHYGSWIREECERRLGDFYPNVAITREIADIRPDLIPLLGQNLSVVSWLWARTVKSPNPAFDSVDVPLISTFILSKKSDKAAYLRPIVEGKEYRFEVVFGSPPEEAVLGTKLGRGANFKCLVSGVAISPDYIKRESIAGRMGVRLIALVAQAPKGKVFLHASQLAEEIARSRRAARRPDVEISGSSQYIGVKPYGLTKFSDLFLERQLVALETLTALIEEVVSRAKEDGIKAGLDASAPDLQAGGTGALAYAQALGVFLALAVDKFADYNNTICTWNPTNQNVSHLFTKQAIPMSWDFCESSPFLGGLSIDSFVEGIAKSIKSLPVAARGVAEQHDCAKQRAIEGRRVISTDPPYYDNVPYSDLSDFFYSILRFPLKTIFPNLFSTIAAPKNEELVAFAHRHDGKNGAEQFFLDGMTQALRQLAMQTHPAFPITIYYAFKQSETNENNDTNSAGWETFLRAILDAGLSIRGTWPMRTEREARARGIDSNALASSIVLVCSKRELFAGVISRREFVRELNSVLPEALDEMTRGDGAEKAPIAPVDLSQAIIGPGMAVFSRYEAVLEADGSQMSVRTALQLINRFLAEDDFDADTQFCLHWFEQNGWKEASFGLADVLARSKSTSVDGLADAGVVTSGGGKVRLFRWAEYPVDWNPHKDNRVPIWEALHQLLRALKQGGEVAAGNLLSAVTGKTESIRQLAYRLYTLCERQGWADDARGYNELITSWSAIEASAPAVQIENSQLGLFGENT
jgi:putative DNA methylase